MKPRNFILSGIVLALTIVLSLAFRSNPAKAEINIFASPIQAGCYIAAPNDCRMHVEPFTIQLESGTKLVRFSLISIQIGNGIQRVIYDFRPDQSNPVPYLGDTYTPSLVAQDFAATCGATYEISLQGQDTGDSQVYNLGLTGQFTCPAVAP